MEQIFKRIEGSFGITVENFTKRFLFNGEDSPEAFLLVWDYVSPTQLDGLPKQQESRMRYCMGDLIFKTGRLLQVPISTTALAMTIAQFFYSRCSFLKNDLREISMGALFLACKSEETVRRTRQIAEAMKITLESSEPSFGGCLSSELVQSLVKDMNSATLKAEINILFELGFEVYKLFDLPHRYIGSFLKCFDRHPRASEISARSWGFLNDSYRTVLCLHLPSRIIAAGCIFTALRSLQLAMPPVPWWILMEANYESLIKVSQTLIELYSVGPRAYKLQDIAIVLSSVGESHGIKNVFPVPYSRKYFPPEVKGQPADSNTPVQLQPSEQQSEQPPSQPKHSKERCDSSQPKKDKKADKKQKKKTKKIHKHSRRESRSASRDHSRSKHKKHRSPQRSGKRKTDHHDQSKPRKQRDEYLRKKHHHENQSLKQDKEKSRKSKHHQAHQDQSSLPSKQVQTRWNRTPAVSQLPVHFESQPTKSDVLLPQKVSIHAKAQETEVGKAEQVQQEPALPKPIEVKIDKTSLLESIKQQLSKRQVRQNKVNTNQVQKEHSPHNLNQAPQFNTQKDSSNSNAVKNLNQNSIRGQEVSDPKQRQVLSNNKVQNAKDDSDDEELAAYLRLKKEQNRIKK